MKSITRNRYLTGEEVDYLVNIYNKPSELNELLEKLTMTCEVVVDFIIPGELRNVQTKYHNIIKLTNCIIFDIEGDILTITLPNKKFPHIKKKENKHGYRANYGVVINDYLDRVPETYRELIMDWAVDILEMERDYRQKRSQFRYSIELLKTQELHLYHPWYYDKLMEKFNKEKERIGPMLKELDKKIKETIN